MNERRDLNKSIDLSADPADSVREDPLTTTDHVPPAADTDGSHSAAEPPPDMPSVPGYRVQREIARGGMGRVLGAYDLRLERDVAVKILLPGANADRFVRESKITARLPHPEAARSLRPENVAVWINLGAALAAKGQVDEAIASYRKAIQLDPKSAMA